MKKFTPIAIQVEEEKKTMEILATGIIPLDEDLEGGFLKKEFVVLGGKTGGGKSLLAGHIFYNMASNGLRCAYFSLEISSQMIACRLMGAKANLSPTRIMIHQLKGQELTDKEEAEADISVYEEFMHFYDDMYVYEDIVKEMRAQKFDLVVVDFLQNVSLKMEEYEAMSAIARGFQQLAKELNCTVLALSQLSNMMNRDTRNKDLVEYKGSGAIGHAADLGFFIEQNKNDPQSLILRLRKNRRGISGSYYNFMIKAPGGRIIPLGY